MDINENKKARILLAYVMINCLYLAALIGIINLLPTELSSALNPDIAANTIITSLLFCFVCFVLIIIGELAEFSSNNIQNSFIYMSLLIFFGSFITIGHLLGDLSIMIGIVTFGLPISGIVLFSGKKIIITFLTLTSLYSFVLYFTYTGSMSYAPLITDTSRQHENHVWKALTLLISTPNILLLVIITLSSITRWKERELEVITLSQRDPLTNAYNRGHFIHCLTKILELPSTNLRHISTIMIDIDHFKRINDQFGHLIGDKAITAVAAAIYQSLPSNGFFCRYGGEEFSIALPNTNKEDAIDIARKINQSINQISIPTFAVKDLNTITVSMGITSIQMSDLEEVNTTTIVNRLLFECDQAMYRVKKGGRNGISTY